MNDIQIFNNPEFGQIRTVQLNNETYFVGKDVAEALGYAKARNAIERHVDIDDKKDAPIQGDHGGTQLMTIINESGLYSLILSSKLESSKRFKHWVTSEVLPTIRKTGSYSVNAPQGKELLALAVLEAQKTIEDQTRQIERMKPKEIFADAVATSETSILVRHLAKILRQNGVDTGEKRLYKWLREHGYLIKKRGDDYNLPTQRSMEQGLFEVKETAITHSSGFVTMNTTSMVTGKGQQYFVGKFLNEKQLLA